MCFLIFSNHQLGQGVLAFRGNTTDTLFSHECLCVVLYSGQLFVYILLDSHDLLQSNLLWLLAGLALLLRGWPLLEFHKLIVRLHGLGIAYVEIYIHI